MSLIATGAGGVPAGVEVLIWLIWLALIVLVLMGTVSFFWSLFILLRPKRRRIMTLVLAFVFTSVSSALLFASGANGRSMYLLTAGPALFIVGTAAFLRGLNQRSAAQFPDETT